MFIQKDYMLKLLKDHKEINKDPKVADWPESHCKDLLFIAMKCNSSKKKDRPDSTQVWKWGLMVFFFNSLMSVRVHVFTKQGLQTICAFML